MFRHFSTIFASFSPAILAGILAIWHPCILVSWHPGIPTCHPSSWLVSRILCPVLIGYSDILVSCHLETWTNLQFFFSISLVHCKVNISKTRHKFSPNWNCAASFPIPSFMFLWAIYIFPRSVYLLCCRKIGGPIVELLKTLTDTWMWNLEQFLFWE